MMDEVRLQSNLNGGFMLKTIEQTLMVCFLVFSLFFGLAYTNEGAPCNNCHKENEFIPCSKTYVDLSQIDFYEQGIYVKMGEFIIQTEAIHADEKGFYFQNAKNDCGPMQKRCKNPICPACVFPWDSKCYSCGKKQ